MACFVFGRVAAPAGVPAILAGFIQVAAVPAVPILAAMVAAAPAHAAAQRPPVEAFGNLPLIDDVQLSPDGRWFAVLRRHKGRRIVVISHVNPAGRANDRGFTFDDGSIEAMRWANADRLLITVEQQGRASVLDPEYDFTRIISVSASGGKSKVLFKRPNPYRYSNWYQVTSRIVSILPLVVLPHGGPQARDVMAFDYQAQFLSNRGYAVLQPQFRGSTGFGATFAEAGEQEWGGKMQDDVTDGVKHLIAEGIADPERICIMGSSYGGYAALMGAVKTPELYRCAISIAGVSDLLKMLRDERKELSIHYWERHIGDLREDRDKLIAASPARQAEKIRIPILLIHGKDDLVVPFDHSKDMAEALERAGKPHRLVPLEGEDHYLTFGETRITALREAERFLAGHLGAPR